MNPYELPTSLNIGGVDFAIRTDFRAVLDVLIAMNDPELDDDRAKSIVMLKIMYVDFDKIEPSKWQEAINKACEFIDCGHNSGNQKAKPRLIDWNQDAPLIIPAVNKVAHAEIRALPYLHWWTFMAYFMEIGESVFSNVISYRSRRIKGKKQEPWEREFYKENRDIIDIRRANERSEEEKNDLRELLGLK